MYHDRHGQLFTPAPEDFVRARQGGFAIMILNGCVLVANGPHAPDVPELPGGGIEDGEDALTAALRETEEETGFHITEYEVLQEFSVHRKFYADDINEYWDYDITYYHLELPNDDLYFDGHRPSPEKGEVFWLPLDDLKKGAPIKYMERLALQELGLI